MLPVATALLRIQFDYLCLKASHTPHMFAAQADKHTFKYLGQSFD